MLLNYPKTGSTFVREVVKKLYEGHYKEFLCPVCFDTAMLGRLSQHGTFSQIPDLYRDRVILSVKRHPFERYISQYLFKWYAHNPPLQIDILKTAYKNFPEVRFTEYLEITDRYSKHNVLAAHGVADNPQKDIGFQTINFISFFSANPVETLSSLMWENDFEGISQPRVVFLNQNNLRADLSSFLCNFFVSSQVRRIVNSISDLNVSRHDKTLSSDYWDDVSTTEYEKKERFLLPFFETG